MLNFHILYKKKKSGARGGGCHWQGARATIKCACQNALSIAFDSQPYIEYMNFVKPQSCCLVYLKLNIQNTV